VLSLDTPVLVRWPLSTLVYPSITMPSSAFSIYRWITVSRNGKQLWSTDIKLVQEYCFVDNRLELVSVLACKAAFVLHNALAYQSLSILSLQTDDNTSPGDIMEKLLQSFVLGKFFLGNLPLDGKFIDSLVVFV
jgi:hypothetical protein